MKKGTRQTENKNITHTGCFSASEWLEEQGEKHKYCKELEKDGHLMDFSKDAYVYSISPVIRYQTTETTYKKRFGKEIKETVNVEITALDKDFHFRNRIYLDKRPKNYPQVLSKIGHSENINNRIKTHQRTWKRKCHLNGIIKFPDISSARSFENFCFDFYKKYKNDEFKYFFKSNEVYLLPVEQVYLNDALEQYMKSQKNLQVESIWFWC